MTFIIERTRQLLITLPPDIINGVLPYLDIDLAFQLLQIRAEEINYDKITEDQAKATTTKMDELPIEAINGILPKMSKLQLRSLPSMHLKNPHLDLRRLKENQIFGMFIQTSFDKPLSDKMFGLLSLENQAYASQAIKNFCS